MDKFKICIVDDDKDDLEIMQSVLHDLACTSSINTFLRVADFYTAIAAPENFLPDVIILDYCLTGALAEDVVTNLRADHRLDHCAIAVYSSAMTQAHRAALIDRGADLCFTKGSTVAEIKAHIHSFCEAVNNRLSAKLQKGLA